MKIALIGYGKMGRLVEELSLRKGHTITSVSHSQSLITKNTLEDADICIDFSCPKSAIDNIRQVAQLKKNLIMGTTGWDDHLHEAKEIVKQTGIGFLYASNFSIGMNLFMKIVHYAASLINHFDEYDIAGMESHHNQKCDSPSGTALALANILLEQIDRKNSLVKDLSHRPPSPNELQFASLRCGSNPGTHSIIFDSPCDTITLTHQAKNRESFAAGAIAAAEWLQGRTGFYTMDNLFQ